MFETGDARAAHLPQWMLTCKREGQAFFPFLTRSLDLSDCKVMTASSGKVISHPLKHKRQHVTTFLNRTVTWLKLWRSK